MILIISHPEDAHTQRVAQNLQQQGHIPFLLDFSRFPEKSLISLEFGANQAKTVHDIQWGDLDLNTVGAVWWRRPQSFRIPEEITYLPYRKFAIAEACEVFGGLPGLLDAQWINVPEHDDLAHRKVFQLRTAERLRIDLPDTLVTNAPAAARAFIRKHGKDNTVTKAFTGTPQAWRETRLIGAAELRQIEAVRFAPVIFQALIKGMDIRVTVVGNHIFAAEIDIRTGDYPVDFRMNYNNADIRPITLPDEVQSQIFNLMKTLGLVYGAIDYRRTSDGRYIFLEINPAGQWLFIEERTGQPITNTLANTLIDLDQL